MYGGILANNPNLEWTVEIETGGGKNRGVLTLLALYTYGLILPTATGWFISKYDAIFSLYAAVFAPAAWWPFHGGFKLIVSNPTSSHIKIMMASMLGIEFTK